MLMKMERVESKFCFEMYLDKGTNEAFTTGYTAWWPGYTANGYDNTIFSRGDFPSIGSKSDGELSPQLVFLICSKTDGCGGSVSDCIFWG